MTIHQVIQGSSEWHALRIQYPLTASEAQAIANAGKGLESLVWRKLSEKYSSAEKEHYTNEHIERGIELEEHAVSIYELETGNKTETVGFVTDEKISPVGGASPDRLVGDKGLLEIKCPSDESFFRMIAEGIEIDSKYEWQMQMQMLFTGREWCDFVVFNPNYSPSILIKRVERDEEKIAKIIEGLKKGEQLIKEIEAKLK